ncbi:ATP-binding protein [Archangium sp.]|uniref:ATP-binding protein n=1 Tax=Archangium sp. TaxID=1872627 RepID=UPI002D45D907|nr:ATP-binding protein [Archangium sp.]HYO57704.1 ATP-binding protein [Archangium sp.]
MVSEEEMAAHPDNAPEISVRTTSTLLLYFERQYGASRLTELFRHHPFGLSLEYLRTPTNFISLRFLEQLAEALVKESGDPQFMRKAGISLAASPEALGFVYYMIRAFGSLEICFHKAVEHSSSYNRVGRFKIEKLERERLVLSYHSTVAEKSRHVCELRMGQFASFPTIWGLPPADVSESQCQVQGADCCRYHLRWMDPLPMWGRYTGLLLGAVGGVGASMLGLGHPAFTVTSLSLAGVSLGSWVDLRREMRRKDEALNEQAQGMMGSLEELQQRYDEMFRINVALEDRVAARTRELTEANVRLEVALAKQKELDRLKSEFFDNVSHELRTPLTLILLTLDSLLQRGPEEFQLPVRQHLETMNRSAARLLRLINNLLDLTKLEAGKTKLRYEPLDLQGFLSSLLVPFEVLADKKRVALELEGAAATPVHVDVARLESVFQNLISNALKFTSQGKVTVRLREDDTWVHVEVIDTGVGIASQDLSVIFDRFAQADSSGTRRFGGTGIGLALVKETLELHKGGIEVSSELGKGSNFHVRLPKGTVHVREELREGNGEPTPIRPTRRPVDVAALMEPEGPGAISTPAVEALPHAPGLEASPDAPRILVVEDEPEIRAFLRNVLKPYYRLLEATNGEEGLKAAQKERPDLIVSDVMMPVMSGIQMLAALRNAPETVDTPIIMLTARQEVDAKVEGLSMGANDYLGKPFSPREMLARIEAQLRLRDAAVRAAENERLAATGLLTSGFAHEVRNPLNGLMNALQPLRESLSSGTPDPAMAVAMLDLIEECGQRIRGLAEGLLSFVRTGSKAVAVDLGASVDASVQALSWRLPPGMKVEHEYQCSEPVWGDPGSLNQVWVNLLDNAVRAIGPDGVVKVSTAREGGDVVVSIIDNGVGIKPEHMDRLFQPFFSTRDAGEGTGLGLALCQRIILRQGGRIRVFSEYGKGTRVEVRLPLEVDPDRILPPLLSEGRPIQPHWRT